MKNKVGKKGVAVSPMSLQFTGHHSRQRGRSDDWDSCMALERDDGNKPLGDRTQCTNST